VTDKTLRDRHERRSALDMPADEFRSLGHMLIEQIADFYDSLSLRAVTRATAPEKLRALIGTGELAEQGMDAGKLLCDVVPLILENSLHNGHPKFLGYITSSAAPLGALADLLAAAVNANVAKWELSPVASEIESQTIRWIADLTGYQRDCGGLMVSGGTMANFLAFVAARRAIVPWDIRRSGSHGDRPFLTVYVSKETHTWIDKAADVCGMGAEAIRWIGTDSQGRMRVDLLRDRLETDLAEGRFPFLVVGTAGNVSTGAVDPLRDLAALCREYGLWFHVDGAYGAPAAVLPEAPDDLHALALADSVAIDPHKWLYCPIEAACVLTKRKHALRAAFGYRPDYYHFDEKQSGGVNYYEHGMQNSRAFRALKVWLTLRQAGRAGYRDSIRGDIRLAEALFALLAEHPEFETNSVNLSIVTFRYVPDGIERMEPAAEAYLDTLNRCLLAELQAGGELFVSNAVVDGSYLLRACVVNFRTLQQDIEAIPSIIAEAGRRLDRTMRPATPREDPAAIAPSGESRNPAVAPGTLPDEATADPRFANPAPQMDAYGSFCKDSP
jgi:aromatic-L-amino-acid/L-tryptophan decarboxylase